MNHSSSQLSLPVKRRRGRPRKDMSLNHAGFAQVPPGVERVIEPQTPVVEKNGNKMDGMVGQAVTGIIESAFDAGYLLSIRIGDCKTILRGIVFKPGHFVPITAENDIAPNVQMIQRNETRLPMENQIRRKRRYRHRADHNGSKGNQLSIVLAPSVPPVGARGTVVPVVLQPVKLTNGLPKANQGAPMDASQAYMEALRERGVQMVEPLAVLPPDGSPIVMASSSHGQVSHEEVSEMQNGNGDKSGDIEHGEETSIVAYSNVVTGDDSDRNRRDPQPPEKLHVRRGTENLNEPPPPSAKPLEALHSNLLDHSKSLPDQFMHYGTGRMTELLQALQENMVENKVRESDLAAGLRNESNQIK